MLKKLAVGGVITVVGALSYGFAAHASLLDLPGNAVKDTTKAVTGTVEGVTNTTSNTVNSSCEAINSKFDSKISDFNEKFNKHLTYYKDQRQKLQLLADQLSDKGIDASKLRADLVLFDLKQKKFQDDKDPILEKLTSAKENKCAGHLISAASDIASAISAGKTLKADANDILTFLNTNIQNDIASLRE